MVGFAWGASILYPHMTSEPNVFFPMDYEQWGRRQGTENRPSSEQNHQALDGYGEQFRGKNCSKQPTTAEKKERVETIFESKKYV